MFDPAHTSDEIDLTDEDCRASLIESEAIGTSFAIPACFDSIRYFELTIETNRGGIFVGTRRLPRDSFNPFSYIFKLCRDFALFVILSSSFSSSQPQNFTFLRRCFCPA